MRKFVSTLVSGFGLFAVLTIPAAQAAEEAGGTTGHHWYAVNVEDCHGGQSQDVFCFSENSVYVGGMQCLGGRVLDMGRIFASNVAGMQIIGITKGGAIRGRIRSGECVSTFSGTEVDYCPCVAYPTNQNDGPSYLGH